MKRPCLALLLLLSGLLTSLFMVRPARSQPLLDIRQGCMRYDLCPFLDDDFYDGGFGIRHSPPLTIPRESSVTVTCPRSQGTSESHTCPWVPEEQEAQGDTAYSGATGYDAAYDEAMYGTLPELDVAVDEFTDEWCAEIGCQPPPAEPKSLPVTFVPMDREPESLAEYFVFYGGEPEEYGVDATLPVLVYAENTSLEVAALPAGEREHWLVDSWDALAAAGRDALPWGSWDEFQCEWIGLKYRLQNRVSSWTVANRVRDVYQTWLTNEAYVASTAPARSAPVTVEPPIVRDWARSALLELAGSLDHAGRMLQNASRQLTQMVENQTPEVPVVAPELD